MHWDALKLYWQFYLGTKILSRYLLWKFLSCGPTTFQGIIKVVSCAATHTTYKLPIWYCRILTE